MWHICILSGLRSVKKQVERGTQREGERIGVEWSLLPKANAGVAVVSLRRLIVEPETVVPTCKMSKITASSPHSLCTDYGVCVCVCVAGLLCAIIRPRLNVC